MTTRQWRLASGAGLILASAALFAVHYAIFRDARQLEFYLLLDLVFVPLQVLLVTFFIDSLMARREKALMMEKLNMAIGVFYSEVGGALLRQGLRFQPGSSALAVNLRVKPNWSRAAFDGAGKYVQAAALRFDSRAGDLSALRDFLVGKRTFLLGMLQNPILLEHESFTELLWAVFHLAEELSARETFDALPEPDYDHISGDLARAYRLLVLSWLSYMRHLQQSYPYLFSLAARLNPFDPDADPRIQAPAAPPLPVP